MAEIERERGREGEGGSEEVIYHILIGDSGEQLKFLEGDIFRTKSKIGIPVCSIHWQ